MNHDLMRGRAGMPGNFPVGTSSRHPHTSTDQASREQGRGMEKLAPNRRSREWSSLTRGKQDSQTAHLPLSHSSVFCLWLKKHEYRLDGKPRTSGMGIECKGWQHRVARAATASPWRCRLRRLEIFCRVQCRAVLCNAVQCSAVQCSAVQRSAVQCSAVQCSAVQCSAVQHSARTSSSGPPMLPYSGSSMSSI